VKKVVVNDDGGALGAADFSFSVNGGTSVSFEGDGQNDLTVAACTYTITEPAVAGYSTSYDNCTDVVVPNGGSATCTITNNDQPATLTLVKMVTNDNGGGLVESDFPAFIDGASVTWGQAVTLNAGLHTASETAQAGYTAFAWGGDCAADGSITLLPGDAKTCTITNDDQAATLTLVKTVINNNGGGLVESDFPAFIDGASVTWGQAVTLDAGEHTASETGQTGYSAGVWGGDCAANGSITLLPGESKTCTITNDDQAATLTLVKTVINDNGGGLTAANFPVFIDGEPASWGVPISLAGGATYTASETSQAGYTASAWGGDCAADGTVSLMLGDSKTCTITNDDQAGTLIVKKVVVNDNGGTLGAADFAFSVDGGAPVSFESDGQNDLSVAAGTYTITEPAVTGYSTSYDNCTDLVIPNGGSATCTITNDDQAATLTLVKTVMNDDGGALVETDFPAFIDGASVTWGQAVTLNAGRHTASETSQPGYTASAWGGDCAADGTVSLALGESKTCTITNDDQAGTLIVKKVVVNDNGGTLGAADFSFSVDGGTPVSFESDGQNDLTVPAGTYSVTEPVVSGYTTSYNNCTDLVIPIGGSATCTITNDDQAATLIVKKVVVNDSGGVLGAADFSFSVNGGAPLSFEGDGQNDLTVPAGAYTVTEPAVAGYTAQYDNCAKVVIPPGGSATCTITNDDNVPELTLEKTAAPTTYDAKDDVIDYSYKLTNSGTVTLYAPYSVTDDKVSVTCPDTPISLAPGESVTCSASYTITQADVDDGSITNIARGNAKDPSGGDVLSNQSDVTVTAEQSTGLTLVKTANPATYAVKDAVIDYSYELKNSGNTTLYAPFTVTDDKVSVTCPDTPASLAPNETIICTASYTITQQDLDDGEVTNAAIGNAKDDPEDGGDVPSNEDSQTVTAVNGPAIDVEKLISVDGGITWQDSDTPTGPNLNNNKSPRFKFEVTNIGNVTLTGISLSDDSIALFFQDDYATACIIPASLTPLESFTCYSVLPWQAGQHTNTATAQGSFRQELVSDTDDGNYFGKRPPGGGGEEEEEEEVEPPVITFTGGFIPVTGFAQGTLTDLPLQPAGKTYANTDMVLKIPVLGKSLPVIGVPYTQEDGWDITWLGNNAGYLEGTAYPTWAGNTVITAHVWDALDQPGPFADLKKLKYGDQVVIEVNGLTYTYEVRESLLAGPKNLKTMLQHEELDWVTLVTCEFYNPFNGDYFFRRLVRAVLVSVE
ncbi:MAG: sortase, partial [Anaerolineae bacterium]|nr:sortase [Anaerolineae bacterium]